MRGMTQGPLIPNTLLTLSKMTGSSAIAAARSLCRFAAGVAAAVASSRSISFCEEQAYQGRCHHCSKWADRDREFGFLHSSHHTSEKFHHGGRPVTQVIAVYTRIP